MIIAEMYYKAINRMKGKQQEGATRKSQYESRTEEVGCLGR